MRGLLLALIVTVFLLLHQDFWFWRTAHPLVFGFLPIGIFYHACYAIGASLLMWLLVRFAWPSHLEKGTEKEEPVKAARAEGHR